MFTGMNVWALLGVTRTLSAMTNVLLMQSDTSSITQPAGESSAVDMAARENVAELERLIAEYGGSHIPERERADYDEYDEGEVVEVTAKTREKMGPDRVG